MHEVLVNRLGGLSLPRKSVVRLTDRPDMTLDVYRGRKTTKQQQQKLKAPITTAADDIHTYFFIVFFFSEKRRLDVSSESSARQRINMKKIQPYCLRKMKVKNLNVVCCNFVWRFKG